MQRVGTTIYWNIVESGVKHYKPQLPEGPVYRVHFIYEEFLTKIILYLANTGLLGRVFMDSTEYCLLLKDIKNNAHERTFTYLSCTFNCDRIIFVYIDNVWRQSCCVIGLIWIRFRLPFINLWIKRTILNKHLSDSGINSLHSIEIFIW